MDWNEVIGPAATITLAGAGLQSAMPIAVAAVGECVAERSGVLNLGLEGMMLSGAFTSFLATYHTGSPVVGVLAGVGVGVLLGAVMAFLSVTLKTEQIINGIAIVLFAQGITAFLFDDLFKGSQRPTIDRLPDIKIPVLGSIDRVDSIVNQNWLFWISLAIALGVWLLLERTRFGLTVRAVGESPHAADSVAVDVARIRWFALLVCGAMAGLGGAVLVVGQLNLFDTNVTAGRGWIAIALVIFGRWRPPIILAGAFLFGFTDALQFRVQAVSGGINSSVPYEFFQALPYLVTLVVMVTATIWARRDAQPAGLGIPFRKGVGS
jgi:general nucleoside transport system permease protein